jgi:hypothetical protein
LRTIALDWEAITGEEAERLVRWIAWRVDRASPLAGARSAIQRLEHFAPTGRSQNKLRHSSPDAVAAALGKAAGALPIPDAPGVLKKQGSPPKSGGCQDSELDGG